MLELLDRYESTWPHGRVTWFTCDDRLACKPCAAREGRKFTYNEARRELAGRFCNGRRGACLGTFVACSR